MVDDDGSEMIEFQEFLSIIKGGSNAAKDGAKDDGTGAIYQFFKDLTSGTMQIDGNENIPFSLFISSQRRRKILQSMWAKDDKLKKDGEKILANYKKQLAEKLAREQAENKGAMSESRGSRRSKMNATSNTILSSKSKQLEAEQ
jgi:centrin-1